MDNYCIVTESTADLTSALVERFEISVIPMRFIVGEREYLNYPDNRELYPKDFYAMLNAGQSSTTSAANMADFEACFTSILEKGMDILYLAFSSALSSTCGTGLIAAEALRERFPERKIVVVDTLCASMGEGLLVCEAARLKKRGYTIEQLAEWVEQNKHSVTQWFTVDDLMHLYRGGRVSAVSAHVGTALGIKPLLRVDEGGLLKPMAKVRGRKNAIEALCAKMGELGGDMTGKLVFIGHGDCYDDALQLSKMVAEKYSPGEICIGDIGPVVGSHTGPGALTLFFLGNGR